MGHTHTRGRRARRVAGRLRQQRLRMRVRGRTLAAPGSPSRRSTSSARPRRCSPSSPRVAGSASCPRGRRPDAVRVLRGLDYSCYARIENRSGPAAAAGARRARTDLVLGRPAAGEDPAARAPGHLAPGPAARPRGSPGSFTYSDGTRSYDFIFSCPTVPRTASPHRSRTGRGRAQTRWRDRRGRRVADTRCRRASSSGRPARPALPPRTARPRLRRAGPRLRRSRPTSVAARAVLDAHRSPSYRGAVIVRRAPDLERRREHRVL